MNADHFDALFRSLSQVRSRRHAACVLAGPAFAGLLGLAQLTTTARKGKRKGRGKGKQKRKKKPTQAALPARRLLTQTFTKPGVLHIPGTGTGAVTGSPASVYPSEIVVSGFTNGIITDINVLLNGLYHTFPRDIDVLLAATHLPGRTATVMSDIVAPGELVNVNLVLDDQAPTLLSDLGTIVSGTYQPANVGVGGDAFPVPAPAPTGNALLLTFNGQNPNGTWQLFVVDDQNLAWGGLVAGWALQITAEVDA